MQGVIKILPTPLLDKRIPVLVRLRQMVQLATEAIIVPPVGTGCPNGWDVASQRMGRCVFRMFALPVCHRETTVQHGTTTLVAYTTYTVAYTTFLPYYQFITPWCM